ncbi:PaaI family thioesterase [Pseudaestuariivita atlantica]|uniref:Phenylacetic acid degradation protein n=1 Tax=Pseudaestuariivita atlantica TaxID=1317121 RepID=A0A0L1JSN4_9RHOB|nr:PaaI family thioesterase [Pseudaestuariivita atlantica]KNG94794.1 phenylacetic acid degradation protein [Pseudaestuariivita atlantica]
MPDIARKIRDSFARQSLITTLGATLDTIADGTVTITAPILDLAKQQHGHGHAALTFAIADSAAGYAALTLMDAEAEVLTAEMKINLLAPASGDRLIAEGRVIKPGRRLVIVQSDVFAETDGTRRHIAIAQGTMIPV